MKKKLYIRFFTNREDQIPLNSLPLMPQGELTMHSFQQSDADKMIIEWMTDYPNGKTDFVWLS